jgi:hypothetical protein
MTAPREVLQRVNVWMDGGTPERARCLGCGEWWHRSFEVDYQPWCNRHCRCTPDVRVDSNGDRP